jgi:2-oxoglutarate ferredoxin oxidoreductase subunit delta
MRPKLFNRESRGTSYIQLDTGKCKACWKCLAGCKNQVIGKVDFLWHKHALIVKPAACIGCLKCVNTCQYDAYSIIDLTKQKNKKLTFNNFLINNLLLIVGLVMIFSGLVLQVGFHMGGHQIDTNGVQPQTMPYEKLRAIDITKIVCGFNYPDWSTIHKIVIVLFSALMIYHTCVHWKWYKGVITKHLIGKNKQVILLSVLFLLVAITGLVPWFIDSSGGPGTLRMLFIEIHDKITLVLIVFLIVHIIQRLKCFISAFKKMSAFDAK